MHVGIAMCVTDYSMMLAPRRWSSCSRRPSPMRRCVSWKTRRNDLLLEAIGVGESESLGSGLPAFQPHRLMLGGQHG